MGGGMGISQGASHRLVNEYTRMAMPENAIGLFPDVGASYFLTRHSKALALYLGMVGKVLNAQDALFCHLADWSLPLAQWPIFFQGLETLAVANTSHRANESRGDLSAQIDKLLTDLKATQTGLPLLLITSKTSTRSSPNLRCPRFFQCLNKARPAPGGVRPCKSCKKTPPWPFRPLGPCSSADTHWACPIASSSNSNSLNFGSTRANSPKGCAPPSLTKTRNRNGTSA